MNVLAEFIVRLLNLLEAEGRAAKRNVVEVIAAALAWIAATVLIVVAVIVLCGALYFWFHALTESHAWALFLLAIFLFVVALGCVLAGRNILNRRRR